MPRTFARTTTLAAFLLAASGFALAGCEQKTEAPSPATTPQAAPHDDHAGHDHAGHDHEHAGHDHGDHDHADHAHAPAPDATSADNRPLANALKAKSAEFEQSMLPQELALHEDGIKKVAESGVLDRAKVVGDKAPDFTLSGVDGQPTTLSDLLKSGPVVLTWYRGGWCPYCNITLRSYQEHLPAIREHGGQLVALTPETPPHEKTTKEQAKLDFVVLHDAGSKIAENYGIVFTLPNEVAGVYEKAFQLSERNADSTARLPLAATYVIDQQGVIQWAFVSADYRGRAEPADIIEALGKLKK